MAERVLNQMQYSEFLGIDRHSFARLRKTHPEQFAPSFFIGTNERWFYSTILEFHKALECQEKNITGGSAVSKSFSA